MWFLKVIWLILFAASFCAMGYGIAGELIEPEIKHVVSYQTQYVDKWQIVEKEIPIYVDREVVREIVTEKIVEVEVEIKVPQVITVETTIDRPIYPSLRYFKTYDELLTFFNATTIWSFDCDNYAEAARRLAEESGFYLGEVPIQGWDYNKIFIDTPMPTAGWHMINFTWVGNDGYYVDFTVQDIRKAPGFVRD